MNDDMESIQNDCGEKTGDSAPKRAGISPVLAARLLICASLAAAALILRQFGGELCENARSFYDEYAVRSLIIETQDSNESFIRAAQNDYQSR